MNLLWLIFIVHSAYSQTTVGTSDPASSNSDLCAPWSCLSSKLGSLDSEVPRHHFKYMFKGLLPQGSAQDVVEKVIDSCFDGKYSVYDKPGVNACPLQSLLLCVLDQFIENCPRENLNTTDACSPVQTEAGTKFMYSQSVYRNIEKNSPLDQELLKTTFTSKCCFVPEIVNNFIIMDCGFSSLLQYHDYLPQPATTGIDTKTTTIGPTDATTQNMVDKSK